MSASWFTSKRTAGGTEAWYLAITTSALNPGGVTRDGLVWIRITNHHATWLLRKQNGPEPNLPRQERLDYCTAHVERRDLTPPPSDPHNTSARYRTSRVIEVFDATGPMGGRNQKKTSRGKEESLSRDPSQRVYLTTEFKEKDKARKLGAWFDWDRRKWYVPGGLPLEPFGKWLPDPIVRGLPVGCTKLRTIQPSHPTTSPPHHPTTPPPHPPFFFFFPFCLFWY